MRPVAAFLPDGKRLHLQHGPIDLVIAADGSEPMRQRAFAAAIDRFGHVLDELVAELPVLRAPLTATSPVPRGKIAGRMHTACLPHCSCFVTAMATVAGAVADTILETMCQAATLERAYVNNGGDIAIHLTKGTHFTTAMRGHDNRDLGRIRITHGQGIGGIATSGRHGRSFSLGIADSVTVLADHAATADAAATLITNAVDLPGHPAIHRMRARDLDPDSDLGDRYVVTACDPLTPAEVTRALDAGMTHARNLQQSGNIKAAALCLGDDVRLTGSSFHLSQRSPAYA